MAIDFLFSLRTCESTVRTLSWASSPKLEASIRLKVFHTTCGSTPCQVGSLGTPSGSANHVRSLGEHQVRRTSRLDTRELYLKGR